MNIDSTEVNFRNFASDTRSDEEDKMETLVSNLLIDQSWTDLCLQPSQRSNQLDIWIDRGSGMQRLNPIETALQHAKQDPFFDPIHEAKLDMPSETPVKAPRKLPDETIGAHSLRTWVLRHLTRTGRSWDAQFPFFDFQHPGGLRIHVILPPLSLRGITVSIRRLHFRNQPTVEPFHHSVIDLKTTPPSKAWTHDPYYSVLKRLVLQKKSGIICGSTGTGKTTLLNSLLGELIPNERVIALEDTPELFSIHPGFLSLQSRPPNAEGKGEVTLRDLLRQTLRMRPDRLVLGECRGSEVLDLLQILNTGHQGALATLHAHSARDALRRLELLILLATEGRIQTSLLRELIAHGIQWVAFLKNIPSPLAPAHESDNFTPGVNGARHIAEIVSIKGLEGSTILTSPICRD